MNSAPLQTAALIAVSMLLGAGAFYYFGKTEQQPVAKNTAADAPPPVPEKTPVAQFSIQFDAELESAVAAAKAARAAGTHKALATTPDEFARALGRLNFRLHDFTARYEELPGIEDTVFTRYSDEMKQLTGDLANLLSDDALMAELEDGDPKALAHHQALMAAGALELDDAVTVKIEAIIAAANAKALPEGIGDRELTPAEEAEFDKKFDTLTAEIEAQIRPLLTAGQLKRLDALGPDQVLFGLSAEGSSPY